MHHYYLMNSKVFNLIINDFKKNLKEDFAKVNGNTYQEYLTIMLKDELKEEQKKSILLCETNEDAITLLKKYKINFSNEMT